ITYNLQSSRDIEYATASFGQGIALTPLATTRALAALGNGGLVVKPYVVQEIRYKGGEKKVIEPTALRRVLKEETSEEITRMLVTVYDDALGGGKYKMERYSIAAKTGTAEVSKDAGGYYEDRYLHSFFGYFPAYQPRFIILSFFFICSSRKECATHRSRSRNLLWA
ncbi:MAG: Peptidoglycan glycosyltransferase, partial [Parcubacteria group bacterium GW2011_GWB1_53_43]